MDVNRCKLLVVSLFMITIWFCILPFSIFASSRGITVKAKTSSGAVKEIQLYSGYHALVVGVSDYDKWPDLPYATKDAQDVAGALKKMGFTVKTIFNPSSRTLTKALNGIAYKYGRESDRAILFYYAGHGETEKLADGTKLGYIIPKDCPLLRDDPEGFVNNAISMKDIEAYSLRIRSKHVLMLFDSCFSGSLFSLVRAVPEDITEKSTLPVRQYITAGTEDEAVPDRSMFKRCLLLGLEGDADLTRDGYITGTELGLYLSDKVIQSTRRAQHPQYGKIRTPELARGDFIFRLASSSAVIEKPSPIPSKAYLSVESNVSGSRVLIDGRYVGTAKLSNIEVSPEEHQIQIEKDGYEPYTRKISFEKGRTRDLYVILNPKVLLKGRLYVNTKPEDARVRILNIGPKFMQGMALNSGRYHVEVSAKGYETQKMWVSLIAGKDETLDIHLKRAAVSRKGKKITNSLGMEFVYIAPGTFMMGSPTNYVGQHQVTLTKGFYMQTTEVTQEQWKAVMGSNPSYYKNCGNNCPVEMVSWNDVQNFIRKLNQREGSDIYRLPTSAEWEYAARAGSTTAFANGGMTDAGCGYDANLDAMGWYCGNSNKKTHPVAQKKANSWGLYDMHGNVEEWCQDWSGRYPSGSVTDPTGSSNGTGRVRRGGSWWSDAEYCRSSVSVSVLPGDRGRDHGFRLVRAVDYTDKTASPDVSAKVIARDKRFIAYDNGTVKDTKTGLMWAAKDNGEDISLKDAKRYCENYRGGGYTDWRMPTYDELKGLYDKSKHYRVKQQNNDVHLTKFIELSTTSPWTSDTYRSEAVKFSFKNGGLYYGNPSDAFFGWGRALPVRSDTGSDSKVSVSPETSKPQIIARDGNYLEYANGVVYDKNTGLEWYAGPNKDTKWYEAKRWVENLNIAGGGWRMPTRKELRTLYRQGTGARNMTPLLKTSGLWAWSGEIKDSSSAWGFGFSVGYEYWENRNASSGARGFAVRSRR
jgi:formylglycine-generating enzyme required for sulfatase activity